MYMCMIMRPPVRSFVGSLAHHIYMSICDTDGDDGVMVMWMVAMDTKTIRLIMNI